MFIEDEVRKMCSEEEMVQLHRRSEAQEKNDRKKM